MDDKNKLTQLSFLNIARFRLGHLVSAKLIEVERDSTPVGTADDNNHWVKTPD